MIIPTQQQIIPIAEIQSQTSTGIFYVEAEISISSELQKFCVLECSGCKQKLRTKERRDFDCTKCKRRATLVPRCMCQIDLIDGSGSTTAMIFGDVTEKMLSMTAEDIFDTTCVKRQLLSINHVLDIFSDRIFRIQLRKSSWKSSDFLRTSLSVLSYVEKEHIFAPKISERSQKKGKASKYR
ncbi:uncharacterized protein LOC107832398 isoform X4 [Nicotiana tabacum]|uniref:Uncharacterized protein LOC107832398 isoform X4 n=3 Tax=Nicotiana tabacum TaxID=4097 RepID=A0AC58S9P9_TOBAC